MTPSSQVPPTAPWHAEVVDRFGVIPHFFRVAPETPEIEASLWGFAKLAYVDSPMPSLFKERLFVYLSRFCEVRYCLARHAAFLLGRGRPAGDAACVPQTVEEVVSLVRRPLARGDALDGCVALLEANTPLSGLPGPDTPIEEAVFACAAHVFLDSADGARCREALRQALDGATLQYLTLLLAFVRAAQLWAKSHPELAFEDDVRAMLALHEDLAREILREPETAHGEKTEHLLAALRDSEAQLAVELGAMTRLHGLVSRLLLCKDLRTALDEVLRATMALLGADLGNVQLFDPETGALEIAAHVGFDERFLEHFRHVTADDGSVCACAMRRAERVIVEDVQTDPLFARHREIAAAAGFRAVQSTPLLGVDGELLGVLSTHFRRPHRPSERDLRMIDLYARQAAEFIQRMRAQASLRQYASELSETDRRKDEFLALLAHELRNPLAPIRNGLHLMKLGGVEGARLARIRSMMERQIEQMVRLVDDLMDVSRISRGKITLRSERVGLADVLHDAVETSRPLIAQMGHDLTVTLPPRPVLLQGDRTRLAQVFVNLLNNAAKYSEHGGTIRVTAEQHGADVTVAVRDSGIGIAADELPQLFELFSQVERSREKAHGGLGIGLSLARRLAEMHGGAIEAHSDGPGKGSEFVVRLPIVADPVAAPPRAPAPDDPIRSALRVLVVDDNRDGADSLATMLTLLGSDTRTAYDGEEAVSAAEAFRPGVVVLDLGLPKLDGYEVCRRLRAQPGGSDMIIIAQTGWGQDEDRRRTRAAGFDHHLVKPVDPNALMQVLAKAG